MARGRVVFLRVFVGDEVRRYRVSGRGLNLLVVRRRDSNCRGLFGREDQAGGGVVLRYAAASKISP